eukprot:Hpha_TRINITY_DN10970_c0_g1::TRINITY_DN10970_c0_g1_i1::g.26907::m.26907
MQQTPVSGCPKRGGLEKEGKLTDIKGRAPADMKDWRNGGRRTPRAAGRQVSETLVGERPASAPALPSATAIMRDEPTSNSFPSSARVPQLSAPSPAPKLAAGAPSATRDRREGARRGQQPIIKGQVQVVPGGPTRGAGGHRPETAEARRGGQ